MIEKTKTVFTILLIVMIVISIGYSIFKMIQSALVEPDLITFEEVALHTIDSNLVTSHSKYYYIKSCFENLIEGCNQSKYDEVYKLYLDDYKEQYEKQEVISKLEKFADKQVVVAFKNVYSVNTNYILEYEMNGEIQYMLINIDNNKQSSYKFAFIK